MGWSCPFFFFLPHRPPQSTLFPYTTLFRSHRRNHLNGSSTRHQHLHRSIGRMHPRSEEHTSELQSRPQLVCRLLLEKKNSWRGRSHGLVLPVACLLSALWAAVLAYHGADVS